MTRTTSRAVQIDSIGGIETLEVREVAVPVPRDGEVLVRGVASTINPIDQKLRTRDRGLPFPLTLGWDLAGIVVESRADGYQAGDRVIAMSHVLKSGGVGTWADLVALPAEDLAIAPGQASLAEAATLPLAGLTALHGLGMLAPSRGMRCLVVGAAGAIGGFAVQLVASEGVTVDGLVSRAEHVGQVEELGAAAATTDQTELPGEGYDAIFDTVGVSASKVDAARLLRPGGRYLTSSSGGGLPDVPGAGKVLVQRDPDGLRRLAGLVDDGTLWLRIAASYPLREIRAAQQRFETGGLLGKIVLHF